MPELSNFPVVKVHSPDPSTLYSTFEWQKVAAKKFVQHYLNIHQVVDEMIERAQYLNIPIGK